MRELSNEGCTEGADIPLVRINIYTQKAKHSTIGEY